MSKHPLAHAFALAILLAVPARSQEIASLYSKEGSVQARRGGEAAWNESAEGDRYRSRDAMRVGRSSRGAVQFYDGFLVRLNEGTQIEFSTEEKDGERPILVTSGQAYFFSREPAKVPRLLSPHVSAAVRGTEFAVEVYPDRTFVAVLEGAVECSNQFGSVLLGAGEAALTVAGSAPVKQILVRPLDAVQWALYYPATVDLGDFADFEDGATAAQRDAWSALRAGRLDEAERGFASNGARDIWGRAVVAYERGEIGRAIEIAETFGPDAPAGALLFKASLHLALGQVQRASDAHAEVERRLSAAPSAARPRLQAALEGQRAVFAIVRNDTAEAEAAATRAVNADERSASAALAMSYVRQSQRDLEGAGKWLRRAAEIEPDSAAVKARLAEIALGEGRLDDALSLVEDAIARDPENAYARTVAGFVHLARYDTESAERELLRAIELDPAAGQPRLGLGLATIRKGQLEEGRVHIEQAVALEPNVSLYRSYLGKSFFEADRYELAERELRVAMDLDPNDPTPLLYRAFNRLSTFRPVGALRDIERSIELNDNRAVYRSSLLLDQDEAVRGASLSRAFTNLGFYEAARVEAIKSLNRSYSNYSAHLLLADSYFTTQLAEASVSERQIADLLSPVNFNFILPSTSGPASFNEYTALFDRPIHRTLVEGSLQSRTKEGSLNLAQAGTVGDLGYFAGVRGERRDGEFSNDDSRARQFRGFLAYQLTPQDKVTADGLFRATENGDVSIPFDEDDRDEDLDIEREGTRAALGYLHSFSSRSNVIAQAVHRNDLRDGNDEMVTRRFLATLLTAGMDPIQAGQALLLDERTAQRTKGARIDAQHMFDSDLVSFVYGAGVSDTNVDQREDSSASPEEPTYSNLFFRSDVNHDESSEQAYLYSTWHISPWLHADAGISYNHLELGQSSAVPPFVTGERGTARFNPKAGITAYPTDDLTLRAAYFETLANAGINESERIEPTLVGGINQLFTTSPGGRARVLGVGADYKWPSLSYVGVEALHRDTASYIPAVFTDIEFDFRVPPGTVTSTFEPELTYGYGEEELLRSYYYQVVTETVTAALEHDFSRFEDETFDSDLKTHRLRLTLNHFARNGFFLYGNVTYRDQEIEGYGDIDGSRDFWVVNAGIGYQLPERHGTILLAFQNIFDEDFGYLPTNRESQPYPGSIVGIAASVNF